ncbi:MAG: prolipoprotein diacylglyceryl transferase [Caldilineaceae bacterium]
MARRSGTCWSGCWIPGLIGARLYYVFIQSPRGPEGFGRFMANPWTILQIWTGGIHIYGAFILGGLALILYARWQKLNLPVYLDGLGIGIPLGQAIGRWANFINQELYGPPTTLPLACASIQNIAFHRTTISPVFQRAPVFSPSFFMSRFGILSALD